MQDPPPNVGLAREQHHTSRTVPPPRWRLEGCSYGRQVSLSRQSFLRLRFREVVQATKNTGKIYSGPSTFHRQDETASRRLPGRPTTAPHWTSGHDWGQQHSGSHHHEQVYREAVSMVAHERNMQANVAFTWAQ